MLEFHDISVAYRRDHLVLDGVSFNVAPGEHVVLLGANGSGKSTLLNCAIGFVNPIQGHISIDEIARVDESTTYAARSIIGYVGQQPEDAIVSTSLEDEVAFGPENQGVPREELRRRVDAALDAVGLADLKNRAPSSLSGGQKQRLSFAGALAMEPRYLLLDEPCSMLDTVSREHIMALIADCTAKGIGALHITHSLKEAAASDRCIVLVQGKIVFTGSYDELLLQEESFFSWGIELVPPSISRQPYRGTRGELYSLSDVSVAYDNPDSGSTVALDAVSASVSAGEFIVIEGPSGAGKSTLLRVLAGILDPDSGTALFQAGPCTIKRTRGNVGLMFQNPEGSFFAETVAEEVAFGPRNFGKSQAEALDLARTSMHRIGLDWEEFKDRLPFTLSGGQARKTAISSVISFSPKVLLADEPTAGLDAPSRLAVRRAFSDESAHATVIVVTHDAQEFDSMADRVFLLEHGRLFEQPHHKFHTDAQSVPQSHIQQEAEGGA